MPHKDPAIAKLYFAKHHKEHAEKKHAYAKAYRLKHPEKGRAASRRWRKRHLEQARKGARESYHRRKELYVAYRRHYRTGCDLETYNARWKEQNGLCAICQSPPFRKHLDADHDHETGKVRGLLCNRCNTALGNFQENSAIIHSALAYLERWK